MAGFRANVADQMLAKATSTVTDKISALDRLSSRFNNELTLSLKDIGTIKIDEVQAPQRFELPEAQIPQYDAGTFPNFEVSSLSIPPMPNMSDIDRFLSNLDVSDLGEMPTAPQEVTITPPQAPTLSMPDLPQRPDIKTDMAFPTIPTIDPIVMPTREQSSVTINIDPPPTIDTSIALPTRPDLDLSVSMPSAPTINEPDLPVKPAFDTSITLPTLEPIDKLNAPVRPDVDLGIELPTEFDIELPELEELEKLELPDFKVPEDSFETSEHPYTELDINLYHEENPNWDKWWEEPDKYESKMFDALMKKSEDMLKNPQNFGLPDAVVRALFDKPRERISQEVERSVQEAHNTFAARGFSMPNGMLAKQVNVARQEGQMKVSELNRDIFMEASKYQIEALRFAVQQGMALEQRAYDRHLETVKRLFEVAKYNVEASFRVYEYHYTLFNTQNEGFKSLVETYRTKLDMFIDGIKLELEAVAAKGQINAQELEVYRAKLAGVTADGELFKTKMLAVQMRVDIIKAQFDVYKTDMQAFAEQLGAERIKLEVFETEMKGEQAKISMVQTQADIYAKEIQAYGSQLDAGRLKLEIFKSQIDAETAKLSVADIQAKIYSTDISAYGSAVGAEKIKVEMYEAGLRGEAIKAGIMQTEAGIYETDVRAETGKAEAGRLKIAVFEAEVKAKQAELGVGETQAKIYSTDMDAFKTQTDAQRLHFDAFDSQVKAETAKAQIYDSTVRAFASRVQSWAATGEVKVKQAQINIDAARAYVTTYLADVDGFKAELQANLSEVQYNTEVFKAQADGWKSQVDANIADSEMQAKYTDMNTRTNLAYAEMQMGEYNAKMTQATEQARIALEAAKASGQYTAQLAAGAMSAAHVSASISGSGSAGISSSDSESESTSHNYSY